MTKNEYNGWYNYETWLTNLWFTNEEDILHRLREGIYGMFHPDASKIETWLESEIEEMMDEQVGGMRNGLLCDLLNAAKSEINFREIAEAWLADWKENYPEDFEKEEEETEEETD